MTDRLFDPPARALVALIFAASFGWSRLMDALPSLRRSSSTNAAEEGGG